MKADNCWCGAPRVHREWCQDHAPRCQSGAHFHGNCACHEHDELRCSSGPPSEPEQSKTTAWVGSPQAFLSRGERKRDQIKIVLAEILATGTSAAGLVDFFASALRELNLVEEAELVQLVATNLYTRRQPERALKDALARQRKS